MITLAAKTFRDKQNKISPGLIAAHITSPNNKLRYHFKSFDDNEEIVIYDKGVYKPKGEIKIRAKVEELMGSECTKHIANEVVGHIRRSSYAPRDTFDSQPDTINVLNGILNLKTLRLLQHHPDKLYMRQIPIRFNGIKTCPTIDRCFNEWVPPKNIHLLDEMLGYLLLNDCRFDKSFWFVGDGENGKSTFLDLVTFFLGKGNCSAVSVHQLCNSDYASAKVFGKMANIYADLPKHSLLDSSIFQAMVSGDTIMANPKYGKEFEYRNAAKMLFSCNKLPDTHDESRAFFRRIELIFFPNSFPQETCDKDLLRKLTTPDELSGLLNRAIAGLGRLLTNNCFTSSHTVDRLQGMWDRLSNPPRAFIEDHCEFDPNGREERASFYNKFMLYCEKIETSPITYRAFNSFLKHKVRLKEARLGPQGARQRFWLGIHCKMSVHVST